jgi:hypothetical protein
MRALKPLLFFSFFAYSTQVAIRTMYFYKTCPRKNASVRHHPLWTAHPGGIPPGSRCEIAAVALEEPPIGVLVDVVLIARAPCVQPPAYPPLRWCRANFFIHAEFCGQHNDVRKPVVTVYHGGFRLHLLGYCQWQVRATCVAHFLPFVLT